MYVTKGNVFFLTIREDSALVIKNIISHVSLKEFSIDFDANPSGNVIFASVSTLCSSQVMLWNQFLVKSTKRNPSFISKWLSTCCNMKAQAGIKVFRAYAEGENTSLPNIDLLTKIVTYINLIFPFLMLLYVSVHFITLFYLYPFIFVSGRLVPGRRDLSVTHLYFRFLTQ